MPRMPLSELKALLDSERNDALAATRASKLSVERSDAMDYCLGDMAKDMPAPEGRSRAVSGRRQIWFETSGTHPIAKRRRGTTATSCTSSSSIQAATTRESSRFCAQGSIGSAAER